MSRAQGGDRRAFEELVRATQGRILRLCLRLLGGSDAAQDVAQDTFVAAYTHLDRLDAGRSPLPWLTTVATRLCLNRLRAAGREPSTEWPDYLDPPAPGAQPDQAWLTREDSRELQAALWLLPDTARAVVVLHYVEEWGCRQIAEALSLSESNVKVTLMRAREKLRTILCR